MLYAKINNKQEIQEFPYRWNGRDVPEDAVLVDTESRKPERTWDKNLFYDNVEQVDGQYVLNYKIEERYDTQEDKINRLKTEVERATQRNEKRFINQVKQIESTYPQEERNSWPTQRQEAAAYNADNNVDTPLLSVLAAQRGITVSEMVSKVLANVSEYNQVYGEALGEYQRNKVLLEQVVLEDESTWVYFDEVSV